MNKVDIKKTEFHELSRNSVNKVDVKKRRDFVNKVNANKVEIGE